MTTSNIPTPLVFEGLDEETQNLITELQLSDIDNLLNAERGKQRESEVTDLEFAADVYRQDLESARSLLFDHHMAQSIATAVRTDGRLVQQAAQEEEEACGDRKMAHRLGGTEEIAVTQPRALHFDTDTLAKLAGLYVSESMGEEIYAAPETWDDDDDEADEKGGAIGAESSQWGATRGKRTDGRQLDLACEACRDTKKFFDVVPAPCQHNYCRDCLRDLFRASLTDESLFPPRCCRRPIPVDSVGIFLTKELKQAFAKKEIEFQTPNRTYCSDPQCSAFIAPSEIEAETGTCGECGTSTCVTCKSTAHAGDCPADSSLQGLLHLAGESGWQRCYSCRRMVELDHGCNHITCRCGAQFCYICGERWKSCECAQWNEDRLLARANVVVQRDEPRLAIDNPIRIQHVQQAARMLRSRHNCTHTSWLYVRGPHQCEECYHHLPQYIFECRQCRIQACNRCKRNRL